jgi:hypothetical protein
MTGVLNVIQLLVIGWLPGAVLFRLPCCSRDRRAALDAEERIFWSVILSVSISLAVVMLLAAAGRYSFARLLVADIAIAAAAALFGRARLGYGGTAKRPTLGAIVPIALIVIGVWRFFPSAEYILGGRDPGTYMAEGVQIAQRGTLFYDDPVVATVPAFAKDLFFPSHDTPWYHSVRFMGFFITHPDRGVVVGQFPHLFPASIAIGYGVDGLTGARRTVGVWAILGVLAFYFAGRRLAGSTAAAAAAALLSLHVAFLWFARYPAAEMAMVTLVWAALLATARSHVDGDPFFAPVAGWLLGLSLFLKIDAAIAVATVVAGVALGTFAKQRPRMSFFATLLPLAALATLYLIGPMRAYMRTHLLFMTQVPAWQFAVAAIAAVFVIWALVARARNERVASAVLRWAPYVLIVATCVAAVYAVFFRQAGGRLAAADAYALRTFTYLYLTLPALIAALIGYAVVVRRSLWRDPALILTVTVFAFFMFYKPRITPDHFWMARRFVPVILPGALLFVAAAAFSRDPATGSWRTRLMRPLIGVALVGIVAVHYSRVSAPLVAHVEYAGVTGKLEELAKTVEDDDLLIVESRNAGGDIHVLGLPLAYIYARNVLVLHSPKPDKAAFAAFLEWAQTKYRRVLFIGSGGTDLLSQHYGVEVLRSERFGVPEYETTVDRLPRTVHRKDFDFGVYRFTATAAQGNIWFDLDVGVQDDLHVVRFHAKETEQSTGRTFRWTSRSSFITVTTLQPSSREVTLWMNNGGRPAAAPPADVEIFLHQQSLGTVRVENGFRPYSLPIPPELAARAAATGGPVELRLVTALWNPARVLGTSDDRDLGVMVDRVAVR